jgi:hypothetical protein
MKHVSPLLKGAVLTVGVMAAQPLTTESGSLSRRDLPDFWHSTLGHVDEEVQGVRAGTAETIAVSPGGRNVYVVRYGEKDDLHSQANYNSAVATGFPAWYARKDEATRPVVLLLGPVHGHEVEGIVGLVNLIHVAETGTDHRGRPWPELKRRLDSLRVLIIPSANPDGRARCPYDSFVGVPTLTMTKYGQGTRRDGSLYGWPGAKAVHPMKGDVGILGAYFNDAGVNPMHDDFFLPMAEETRAILRLAREEAPDVAVSLHSHESAPAVLQPSYVPAFMKERVRDLSRRVQERFAGQGLPYGDVVEPRVEDERPGPTQSFNLTSALHHVSGTMAFTFECSHGSVSEESTPVSHDQILDVQMVLYDEILRYALEERLYWRRPDPES